MMMLIFESVINIGPLKLTKAPKESIGILKDVKKLMDKRLLLFCTDCKQQQTIFGIKSMINKSRMFDSRREKMDKRCDYRNSYQCFN